MASAEDELREELEAGEPDELKEPHAERIVEPDEGVNEDDEADLVAELIDDGDDEPSAEEAAVHIEEAE
ncbi:MAG TPA: DUF5709 domain-containing protein [Acidimicrobiales bacterium]|jgi:hypothetical protein|nr:DUF5709 domain-containing protein [Acidimicrobiales bacterium]